MPEENKFVTIYDAVEAALEDWSKQGTSIGEMEMLVDDFVQKAITQWQDTPVEDLPITVSASDAGTISGAVLNALADWHSGDTDPDEMESMAEDFALSAIEDWKSSHGFGEEVQAAP